LTWTGSYQRQLGNDWSFEARYVGTRGIHLLSQNRLNIQAKVAPEDGRPGLPTFFTAPSQATLNALDAGFESDQCALEPRASICDAGFDGAALLRFFRTVTLPITVDQFSLANAFLAVSNDGCLHAESFN
jgi:hypothetical protein